MSRSLTNVASLTHRASDFKVFLHCLFCCGTLSRSVLFCGSCCIPQSLRGICVVGTNFVVRRFQSCYFLLSFWCSSSSFVCLVIVFFVLVTLFYFFFFCECWRVMSNVYVSCRYCLGCILLDTLGFVTPDY